MAGGGRENRGRGRHRRRQRTQRAGGRRHLRQGRSVGAGVRGPADAGRRRPHPRRPRVLRRGPRHLLGRAPAGAGVAVLRGVRPARPRRAAGGAGDRLRQPAARPARRGRLPRPRPHLRRTGRRRVVASAARARWSSATTACSSCCSATSGRFPPDPIAARPGGRRLLAQGTPAWRALRGDGRPCAVHRRCRTHDFADAVAGVVRRGADAGHAGAHRRLADTGRRQPGHPRCADRRPARARRHADVRRGGHPTARRVSCFSTPPRPRCCRSTATRFRPVRKGVAALPLRARASRRSTSCCPTTFHGRDPRLARCADPAHGRNPRADGARRTRGRRGQARRMADGARRPAAPRRPDPRSTRRADVRCGRTRTCRRARPSTRPKP